MKTFALNIKVALHHTFKTKNSKIHMLQNVKEQTLRMTLKVTMQQNTQKWGTRL